MHIFTIVNNAPTTKQRQTKGLASPSFPVAASRLTTSRERSPVFKHRAYPLYFLYYSIILQQLLWQCQTSTFGDHNTANHK